ncbi:hypothetical protein EJ07DRAFT_160647 [Lizonia empirigonia]|nr:hypothetical protein EJ07DRAFT_160647 [Lizonia empirigonia]
MLLAADCCLEGACDAVCRLVLLRTKGRKVLAAAMGDSDVSKKDDVSQVARRLSCTASGTAQVLYTVAHIDSHLAEAQIMKDVAQKSYALAAALSSLQEVLDASGEQGVWTTKEHGENLLHSMRECDDIFQVIGIQVRKADQEFKAQVRLDTGGEVVERVFDDERDRKAALDKCFQLVVHTNLLARHSTLAQKTRLVDEIPQALCLTWAFEHPALAKIRANINGLLASDQLQEYCLPSPPAPGSSADEPKSQSDPTTLTLSSTQIEEPISRKPTQISTYNQWPPFGDPQHPAYLATMTLRPKTTAQCL